MDNLTDNKPQQPSSPPNHSQLKLMKHFETINQTIPKPDLHKYTHNIHNIDHYTLKASPIDLILDHQQTAIPAVHERVVFAQQPMMGQLHGSLNVALKRIGKDFSGKGENVKVQPILDLQNYSTALLAIGRSPTKQQKQTINKQNIVIKQPSQALATIDKTKDPFQKTQQSTIPKQSQIIQIQTNPLQQSHNKRQSGRADIILMQLMRQKKRKQLGKEYFGVMEMKLIELLDYILEDQQGYAGLDPTSRTKAVLKNLQSFQGKMVDGQSKINLLRIFFEQFTALKKDKEQLNKTVPSYQPPKRKNNNKTTTLPKRQKISWSEQQWIGSTS